MSTFLAIDLKSFYASVECVERGLDPFTTNLVVADESRTDKTICLAVSPSLKKLGLPGRPRLFEVKHFLEQHYRATGKMIPLIIAPPRMRFYIDYSRKIYNIYTSFFSPNDIHVYSIDEVFIDATSYLTNDRLNISSLAIYDFSPVELANRIVEKINNQTGITATAGIGSNLYLAKIAMDILAKHAEPNSFGCRVASLDEISYRKLLWNHQPLTDFWRIGRGIAQKLIKNGINTMGDLARVSLHPHGEEFLYKLFGIDAEILIDHAWGIEPTRMQDIKNYHSKEHSLSNGQVLAREYSTIEGEVVLREMIEELCLQLTAKHLLTNQVVVYLSQKDQRIVHFYANFEYTNNLSYILNKLVNLYHQNIDSDLRIRRFNLSANHVIPDTKQPMEQPSLFANRQALDQAEVNLQEALLDIKSRYGKNAILRGTNFESVSTARERHQSIGGHRA